MREAAPVADPGPSAVRTSAARLLGTDQPNDLAAVAALFVVYAVIERATRSVAVVGPGDLGRFSLVVAAVAHRWWLVAALVVAAGVGTARQPGRMLAAWNDLEQGRALRLLGGSLILVVAWQSSLYDYNWLAGQTHGLDRILVAVLAAAALVRPAFLVPFVLVVRVVNDQFLLPFDTAAGRNIDDLLLLALLAIAAAHLLYVITGRNRTAAAVLLMTAALAAHFFIPGKGKLAIGWLSSGDLSNLPLASYTAGWLGHTNGRWAEVLSGFYERFRWPVMVGTAGLELGAIVAVLHPRLTRLWLPGWIVFHLVTFATTGFWFLPWIVVEVGLLTILRLPSLRSWVAENATPARGLLAAVAVVGAPVLFHPPGLAWLDAPLSYGYEVEGTGVSGAAYHVPISAFGPLSHHVAFDRLQLGSTVPVSGAYGAVATAAEVAALEPITDFDQLTAYEATFARPTLVPASQSFMMTFLEYANRPRTTNWYWLGSPDHFWTSRPEPSYHFQEPLAGLQVFLVRSIHHDGHPDRQRQRVLTLAIDSAGATTEGSSDGRGQAVVVSGAD
jgi:hypothetical protein